MLDNAPRDNLPLVSVIIAVCADDRTDFFYEAIRSILGQSMSDLECIIAGDGPLTPQHREVIHAIMDCDARVVRVDLAERSGPAAVRNHAVAHARGRYVAILDSDDLAHSERLAKQVEFMSASGVDIAGAAGELIDNRDQNVGKRRAMVGEAKIRQTMWKRNPLIHSAVMAKTEILRDHPYPEALRYGEDYRLWVDLAIAGLRIDNLENELVRYRVAYQPKHHGNRLYRARTDLSTRLRALRLLPVPRRILYAPAAILIALSRILPSPVWRAMRRRLDSE